MSNKLPIAAMLRVKNEERWIGEVIRSIQPITKTIFVMDDHSDDRTQAICDSLGCHVYVSPYADLNEVRDKNYILGELWRTHHPEWVLAIDGDEVLEPGATPKILAAMASGQARSYAFRIRYAWDRPDQERVDGIYARFRRQSLFCASRSDRVFRCLRGPDQAGGFHCTNVPGDVVNDCEETTVWVRHYGYMNREDRIRKWNWYNSIDPGNRDEDEYRHCVQGDIDAVPATAQLKHAGPLRLVDWT